MNDNWHTRETWTNEQLEQACDHLYAYKDVALSEMKELLTSHRNQARWMRFLMLIGWLLRGWALALGMIFVASLFGNVLPDAVNAIDVLFASLMSYFTYTNVRPRLKEAYRQTHYERHLLPPLMNAVETKSALQSVPDERRRTLLPWLRHELGAGAQSLKTAISPLPLQLMLVAVVVMLSWDARALAAVASDDAWIKTLSSIWWAIMVSIFLFGVMGLESARQSEKLRMKLRVLMSEPISKNQK